VLPRPHARHSSDVGDRRVAQHASAHDL
jgi:hypothetical protein